MPGHERLHAGYQGSEMRYASAPMWIDSGCLQFAGLLRLGRIDFGKGIKRQHGTAFLVIFGSDDTNCQGQQVNGKEKKQHTILGVPSQKQKNEGAEK